MQIHVQHRLIILQHEPGNLKREISSINAKHYKQEASILVNTSIVQIILVMSKQSPGYFRFEIIGMSLSQ